MGVIHKPNHKHQIELLLNAPKGNDSDSSGEATDNTSVVEPARPSYKSIVPSIEQTFGDYESNKAKKQLKIEKAKSNNYLASNLDNTDAVIPQLQSYKSFVPSIESLFPRFKDIEEEETNDIIIQADTDIESQPPASPDSKAIEPAPEPEAAKYAVIIAGYMAKKGEMEVKGENLTASLNSDASILEVRRRDSNEIILSGY